MGSGAGKVILPLVSLAAAPLTGGASLGGLAGLGGLVGEGGAGSGFGTVLGLANAGIGALRSAQRDRAEDAALAADIQSTRTDQLLGEIDLAEKRADAERQRARQLASIANSGRVGPGAKPALAGASERDSRAAFASLDTRQLALQSQGRNRLAALRRRGRQNRRDRLFGGLEGFQQLSGDIGPLINTFS